jgi:hypothetical protein
MGFGRLITIKIEDAKLRGMLNASSRQIRDVFDQALVGEAELIMREARKRVPLDKGTLRASGIVLPVERSPSTTIVRFGFGGAASRYAYIQHVARMPPFHHKPGRTELYLYNPVEERMPYIEASIARRVAALLGGL